MDDLQLQLAQLLKQREELDKRIAYLQSQINQPQPPPFKPAPKKDFENFLGVNVLSKVGIVIAVLGLVFAIKVLFDKNLIGNVMRVVVGYAFSFAMLFGAWKIERKHNVGASMLFAGGITLAYTFSILAYSYFDVFNCGCAIASCFVLSAFCLFVSFKYHNSVVFTIALFVAMVCTTIGSFGDNIRMCLIVSVYFILNVVLAVAKYKNIFAKHQLIFPLCGISLLYWILACSFNGELPLEILFLLTSIPFLMTFVFRKKGNIECLWRNFFSIAIFYLFLSCCYGFWNFKDAIIFLIICLFSAFALVFMHKYFKEEYFDKAAFFVFCITIVPFVNLFCSYFAAKDCLPVLNGYFFCLLFYSFSWFGYTFFTSKNQIKEIAFCCGLLFLLANIEIELFVNFGIIKYLVTENYAYSENNSLVFKAYQGIVWAINFALLFFALLNFAENKLKFKLFDVFSYLGAIVSVAIFLLVSLHVFNYLSNHFRFLYHFWLQYVSYLFVAICFVTLYFAKKSNNNLRIVTDFMSCFTLVCIGSAELSNVLEANNMGNRFQILQSAWFVVSSLFMIIFGLKKKILHFRIFGFVLVFIAVIQILVLSLSNTQLWLKALVFIVLGVLIMIVSRLYLRKNKKN